MNIFAKNSTIADELCIDIFNEPEFYTSGDRVRGQLLVSRKYWQQVSVEVLLICEEHAELNPQDVATPDARFRRCTIAGDTLEGEPFTDEDGDGGGMFPFELPILDDPRAPYLLPSFEVDSGDLGLTNAIRWLVEARVVYKGKEIRDVHEIVVIPSRPSRGGDSMRLVRQTVEMRAYEPKSAKMPGFLVKRAQSFHTAQVSGVLSVPEAELGQFPATLPLKFVVLVTPHPSLLRITKIYLQLITEISAEIDGESSSFTVFENLRAADNLDILLNSEHVDLTEHVSGVSIENTCSSFAGRWLKMRHRLQVKVALESVEKRDSTKTLTLSTVVVIMPPAMEGSMVDAPPRYSPSTSLPLSAANLLQHPSGTPSDERRSSIWTTSETLNLVNQMDQLIASSGL